MKHHIAIFIAFALHLAPAAAQGQVQPSSIMLKLKGEKCQGATAWHQPAFTGHARIDAVSRAFGAVRMRSQALGRATGACQYLVQFPPGADLQRIAAEYLCTGLAEYAEPESIAMGGGVQDVTPADTYYYRQWALHNDGSFTLSPAVAGADISMEQAWGIEQGSSSITVAILDSGCRMGHPELAGRLWTNSGEVPGNGIDDDGNGYVDDVNGWDFVNDDNNPADDHGHGTNVVGIIGANGNNGVGYAGVDWNCRLMVLKVLDQSNTGSNAGVVGAIYYAVDNGARVINMSLGSTVNATPMQAAVDYALDHGVVVVACMMNTNSNTTTYYPAGYPAVIAVGATDANDRRSSPFFWDPASGSNYGNHISVVAPGNYIYGLNHLSNSNYGSYWGGTSQATPHVAGLAALLLAQAPSRTPAEVKSIIESTAEDQVGDPAEDTPGWDQYYGHGRVNAYLALNQGFVGVTEREEPRIAIRPNPAPGAFMVALPQGAERIRITDAVGRVVLAETVSGRELRHYRLAAEGLYHVSVEAGRRLLTERVIICGH